MRLCISRYFLVFSLFLFLFSLYPFSLLPLLKYIGGCLESEPSLLLQQTVDRQEEQAVLFLLLLTIFHICLSICLSVYLSICLTLASIADSKRLASQTWPFFSSLSILSLTPSHFYQWLYPSIYLSIYLFLHSVAWIEVRPTEPEAPSGIWDINK